ncbi:LysM domain-containing protein [Streptococcus sp. X16XC17]|uniref:aggregation-promoting factor n=1 Tax=unclassified Streptococcus TaxID=2608887 RepID=UPI0009E79029|nr:MULTISPECIES: LysM domain-containing protein [unclassified Streptococcus]TCD45463.1 LysM domain-containing protein [Streptococcus sp. X16XC17]
MKISQMKTLIATTVAASAIIFAGVASAETYTVKSGDTLSELAVTFETTVDAIATENKIQDANLIYVGQVLEINEDGTAGAAAPAAEAATAPVSEPAPTPAASTYASNLNVSEAAAKEEIARRESGGSYTAQNGQYYGRYQLTNTYLNGDYSAENQERVADAYVANRYVSWSAALAFWNANGWY